MLKSTMKYHCFVATIILFFMSLVPIYSIGSHSVVDNHPQPGIWDYENQKNQPTGPMVLELEHQKWQFTAAACITPAFIDRFQSTPILFDDGIESRTLQIPYESKTIASFGTDVSSATAAIAKTYWNKAEIVIITDTYERVLWLVPTASFLSAPILVNPSTTTLQELGTKCAIVLGVTEPDVEEIIKLNSQEEVWEFQLALFNTKGKICDYVILTNPSDTDDTLNPNIKWPYLSIASAPLAAYRKAIMQTGDWTADKTKIESMEMALSKDTTLYNEAKTSFDRVKADSYAVESFLLEHSHVPEYLAVVGGPYAVPNYFYDIHVNYTYPTGNPQVTVYPSSIGAYATLSESISSDQYVKEDLAAGRIMTSSVFDASKQLMKTFFYREYLPGGIYHSVAPADWEKTASIIDGHRLNQPEPNNLYWDSDIPYHPALNVTDVFVDANFNTTYYLPRNESDPFDFNKTIIEIMNTAAQSSLIQFLPHGGKTSLRIETGIEPIANELTSSYLTAGDVRNMNFKGPTIVYTGCCKGANPFMLDEGLNITEFVTPGFIHAGCVAYIATPEIQSTCFWREAPYGVSTQQTIYTWEKLVSSNMPIGKALRVAKWDARKWAYEMWPEDAANSLRFEVDCIIYNLFGDPKLEPYKPDIDFESIGEFDIDIDYGEVKAGDKLNVNVGLSFLGSDVSITDADVTIFFEGVSKEGYSASFDVPKEDGNYVLTVSVIKAGYQDITAKYLIHVEKEQAEDNSMIMVSGVIIIIIIVVVVLVAVKAKKKS
jgi:hypothetical protein